MKKSLLFLVSGLFALTACEKVIVTPQSTNEISFKSEIASATKVTGTQFDEGDEISVVSLDESLNYSASATYTYSGETFTSDSPIKKTSSDEKLAFWATYPTVSAIQEPFTFEIATDQSGDNYELSDLLVASTVASSDAQPTLSFYHALSGIVYTIKDIEGAELADATVTFSAVAAASCDIANDSYTASGAASEITPSANKSLIIAPQTITAGTQIATIVYEGTEYPVTLNNAVDFASAMQYTCSMVVDPSSGVTAVEFTAGQINDWNEGDITIEPAADFSIDLKISEITSTTATVEMTPSNNDTQYLFALVSKSTLSSFAGTDADFQDYLIGVISSTSTPSNYYATGVNTIQYQGLSASSSYCLMVFACDGEVATSDLFRLYITTLSGNEDEIDAPADMTISVEIDESSTTSETIYGVITPSLDNAHYFYGICEYSLYTSFEGTDAEFMSYVLLEWANGTIAGQVKAEYTNVTVNGLTGDTEMMLLAFGVAHNGASYNPTTALFYDTETTEEAPFTLSTVEFGTVTTANATSTYFDMSARPNDKTMPYYFGVVSYAVFYSWYDCDDYWLIEDDMWYSNYYANRLGMTLEEYYESILEIGDCDSVYGPTYASNDYVIYAYGFDATNLQPLTKVEYSYISTLTEDAPQAVPQMTVTPLERAITLTDQNTAQHKAYQKTIYSKTLAPFIVNNKEANLRADDSESKVFQGTKI